MRATALNGVSWPQLLSPCEIKSFTAQVPTAGSAICTPVRLAGGLREEAEHPCGISPMSSQRDNGLQNKCHCVLSVMLKKMDFKALMCFMSDLDDLCFY